MELKHFNECIEWWNNRTEIIDEDENPKAKKYVYKDFEERDFDLALCGYPHAEEIVLSLKDTIQTYEEERLTLNSEIDKIISEITQLREVFQEGKE